MKFINSLSIKENFPMQANFKSKAKKNKKPKPMEKKFEENKIRSNKVVA